MSDGMGIHTFYLYQISWYVFATVVSFLTGWFFWNKGESLAQGKLSGTGIVTYKLTGAASIFVIVLFLFYTINPLKPLSDYNKIMIVYGNAAAHETNPANPIIYSLKLSDIQRAFMKKDKDRMTIEMVPFNSIYTLTPTLGDENTFKTRDEIPPGNYQVRFIEMGTGRAMTYQLDVP
jgi:hypothetical protein